jgi:di/tricarboxylate transporter
MFYRNPRQLQYQPTESPFLQQQKQDPHEDENGGLGVELEVVSQHDDKDVEQQEHIELEDASHSIEDSNKQVDESTKKDNIVITSSNIHEDQLELEAPSSSSSSDSPNHSNPAAHSGLSYYFGLVCFKITQWLPVVSEVTSRMPWKIIPFALGMFVLVEALDVRGWIRLFAQWLNPLGSNIALAVFGIGILSSLACNLINNQPMTILFVRILQDAAYQPKSLAIAKGGLFALVLGSNFGANLTLIGALAGIMWSEILKKNQLAVGYFQFLLYGVVVMPLVILVACAILTLELYFFPDSSNQMMIYS